MNGTNEPITDELLTTLKQRLEFATLTAQLEAIALLERIVSRQLGGYDEQIMAAHALVTIMPRVEFETFSTEIEEMHPDAIVSLRQKTKERI